MKKLCKLVALGLSASLLISGCSSADLDDYSYEMEDMEDDIDEAMDEIEDEYEDLEADEDDESFADKAKSVSGNINKGSEKSADEDDESDDTENADTEEAQKSGDIVLEMSEEELSKKDTDGTEIAKGIYTEIDVETDGYDKLEAALDKVNAEQEESVTDILTEYADSAAMHRKEEWFSSDMLPYYYEYHADKVRADDQIVSIMQSYFSFSGGAHPTSFYRAVNINTATGEELKTKDVILEIDEFADTVENEALKTVDKEMLLTDDISQTVKDMINDPENHGELTFTIGREALTVCFSPYDITAYAAGPLFVEISYAENPRLFYPDITGSATASGE